MGTLVGVTLLGNVTWRLEEVFTRFETDTTNEKSLAGMTQKKTFFFSLALMLGQQVERKKSFWVSCVPF